MRQDAIKLQRFYASRLGQAASGVIAGKIDALWGGADGLSVLGLGYAPPLLETLAGAKRCVAAMPDAQGVCDWRASQRGGASLKTDEARLPFADGLFDRTIVFHGVEEAESPRAMVRELWRVMAPEGRIIIAAANRRGLWARAESTPFGHGRPWTKTQLVTLLSDASFQVTASAHALHIPPVSLSLVTAATDAWERAGELILPGFGGVVLVEAVKRLYIEPRGSASAPAHSAAKARKGAAALPRNEAPDARSEPSHRR